MTPSFKSRAEQEAYQSCLKEATLAYRTANLERALELGYACVKAAKNVDFAGHTIVAESLFKSGRLDELAAFIDSETAFQTDPRGILKKVGVLFRNKEHDDGINLLKEILREKKWQQYHRPAGFELVRIYDHLQRYEEAWQQAVDSHRLTTKSYPIDTLCEIFKVTANASREELQQLPRATRPVERVACFLGLPRSGTTILEQALDRHSKIKGVSEIPRIGAMCDQIAAEGGGWPIGAARVSKRTLDELQNQYRQILQERNERADQIWSVDKTLFPTNQPLFINGVLPGTKVIRTLRDPRDNAIGIFLSAMDPASGWTGHLRTIQKMIRVHREFLPIILEKLEMDTIDLRLEKLIEYPEKELRKIIDFLGLSWEEACMTPEQNDRLVLSLSHAQVRNPFNRKGIGRWENYAKFFDESWEELV